MRIQPADLNAIFALKNYLHFLIATLHVVVEWLERFGNFTAMNVETFLQYHYLQSIQKN